MMAAHLAFLGNPLAGALSVRRNNTFTQEEIGRYPDGRGIDLK